MQMMFLVPWSPTFIFEEYARRRRRQSVGKVEDNAQNERDFGEKHLRDGKACWDEKEC